MALIPPEVLPILREESAYQFDTMVYWVAMMLDENGKPVRDKSSNPVYDTAGYRTLDARIVQVDEAFYNLQGIQIVATERVYVPAGTGVRIGDKLLHNNVDPTLIAEVRKAPPIVDVREMPSPSESIFELIRTGSAAASGTPLGT